MPKWQNNEVFSLKKTEKDDFSGLFNILVYNNGLGLKQGKRILRPI